MNFHYFQVNDLIIVIGKLCYNMMINKQHLTSEGRSKIKTIKAGMNSKRFFYNWDHLEDLKNCFLIIFIKLL